MSHRRSSRRSRRSRRSSRRRVSNKSNLLYKYGYDINAPKPLRMSALQKLIIYEHRRGNRYPVWSVSEKMHKLAHNTNARKSRIIHEDIKSIIRKSKV